MGEVDELDNAVDDGVPQGDQGDKRPVGHPEDQVLGKEVPVEFHAGLSVEFRLRGRLLKVSQHERAHGTPRPLMLPGETG
jgi:hypothetical protein